MVDWEVVALDPAGRPDFGLLQERLGVRFGGGTLSRREKPAARQDALDAGSGAVAPLVYQAFDLLYLDGLSLLEVPLEERKRLLRSVLREGPHVRYATHVDESGIAFLAAASQRGLEGVMAKQRHSRYEPGRRVATWLKLKNRPEQEFVIGGYLPGEGNARDLGSVLVGYHEAGPCTTRGGSAVASMARRGPGSMACSTRALGRTRRLIRPRLLVPTCAAWSGRNRRS